jgi:hypothetical protein
VFRLYEMDVKISGFITEEYKIFFFVTWMSFIDLCSHIIYTHYNVMH